VHGGGIDRRRDVLEAQRSNARLQPNLADVSDEREIEL